MKFQWVILNNRAKKYGVTKENVGRFADEMVAFNERIAYCKNGNPAFPVVNGEVVQREQVAEGLPAGRFKKVIGVWLPLVGEPMEGPEAYAGL